MNDAHEVYVSRSSYCIWSSTYFERMQEFAASGSTRTECEPEWDCGAACRHDDRGCSCACIGTCSRSCDTGSGTARAGSSGSGRRGCTTTRSGFGAGHGASRHACGGDGNGATERETQ